MNSPKPLICNQCGIATLHLIADGLASGVCEQCYAGRGKKRSVISERQNEVSEINNPQIAWLDTQIAALEQKAETLRAYSQKRQILEVRIVRLKRYRVKLSAGTVGVAPFMEIGEI